MLAGAAGRESGRPIPRYIIRMTNTDANPPAASLAVVRCPGYEPERVLAALRIALEALGGLGRWVKPGQTVLLKPNLLSARPPEEAVTTHPALVEAMVKLCREAGAGRVWIADSPAGSHAEPHLWRMTGMADVATCTGAELKSYSCGIVPVACGGNDPNNPRRFLPTPAWYQEADVVISLPKLKTHALTTITCGMKNVFGLVSGQAKAMFHANFPSPVAMSSFLADVYGALQPHLTLVDAIVAMEGAGPANGKPKPVGVIVAGTDAVAVDSLCCLALGIAPEAVPMIRFAVARGYGRADWQALVPVGDGLEALRAVRMKPSIARRLQRIPEPLFRLLTRFTHCRPQIDQPHCIRCGICAGICPVQAIPQAADGRVGPVDGGKCILCMCCVESCPRHAVEVGSPLMPLVRLRAWVKKVLGKSKPS